MDNGDPPPSEDWITLTEASKEYGCHVERIEKATRDGRLRCRKEPRPIGTRKDGSVAVADTRVVLRAEVAELVSRPVSRSRRGATLRAQWQEKIPIVVAELRRGCTVNEACRRAHISATTVNYLIRTRPDEVSEIVEARAHSQHIRASNRRGTVVASRVYAIAPVGGGPVKFGITRRPVVSRLRNLQVGSPFRLVVRAAVEAPDSFERWLHAALSPDLSHGEWFRDTARVRAIVALMEQNVSPLTPDGMAAYKAASRQNPLFGRLDATG